MIHNLKVKNFRSFKSVQIDGLKRINLIVGKNASGKTVLLEAIKIGLDGLPGSLPWINQTRTIVTALPVNPTQEQFQSLFVDLFRNFETKEEISISLKDSQNRIAELRVHFDVKKATTIQTSIGFQSQQKFPSAPPTTIIPLAFERINFDGKKDTLLATVNEQGNLFFDPGAPMGIVSGLLYSNYFGFPAENAAWWSQLKIEKRNMEIEDAIKRHFPFISEISVESPMPGITSLYADVGLSRRIPLSLVSGGVARLFAIMLSIVQFKGGVVLVDEIENGIYYNQYPMVWETLIGLAKEHDTQLFISTHSLECLRSLLPSLKASEEEILLLRIERENDLSKVTPIQSKFIEAAIKQGLEIR
ncbi:MAG: AAA family ATPase [Syntrophobacteraceae bacterium]